MAKRKDTLDKYYDKEIDKILRFAILTLWTSLVKYTPVDTGRARAGWFISKGRPSEDKPVKLPKKQKHPRPKRPSVKKGAPDIWYITNNVEYIDVLDQGRGFRDGQMRGSKEAPNGMTVLALYDLSKVFRK